MFKEGNQRCSDRSNLLRSNVHQLYFRRFYNRIIGILTRLNLITDKCTVIIQRSITLCYDLSFFFLSRQVNESILRQIYLSVIYLTVRSFNKAEIINLSKHTKWRNQTDIRTFRCFNRTKASVVCIVNVTNLKSGTFTRQTTRTKSRHTTFVSDFSQRVCLVHKLWQCVSSEEWIDHRRNSLRIDQVNRSKHLIVTNVHSFADGTWHTCQTDSELIGQLFAYSTYATVAQVVDIIYICFWVNQLNQIFDDLDNIFFSEDTHVHVCRQVQFLIDSITTYITKVIPFFREEQVINNFTGTGIIGRVCITQLTVDIKHSLLFRVTRVLLKGIIYNRVVGLVRFFLVNKDVLNARVNYFIYMFRFDYCFTVDNDFITFNRNNFTGIFINEIFNPGFQDTRSQFTTYYLLEISLINLHIFSQVKNLKNVLVVLKADSS